ncbi:hypothetical protein F66182_2206 [Fusarium sp. NRRL 66182]|nr:hypothetical protein F66182_2206 [Fusarium sp. NRRL 66182]
MLLFKDVASFYLASIFFLKFCSAAPNHDLTLLDRRDDSDATANVTVSNGTATSLEPVVPPEVDPEDLAILKLDTSVTLAWAGAVTAPGSRRRLKRDEGIFSEANFTFAYPTVPLDYSTYVSGITCSIGRLTATLSPSAYKLAKKQWKGAVPIIFVTAVDGCGDDNANDFFIAKSISFSDKDKTFAARGVSAGYRDVTKHFNLKWGNVGALNLKRSIDKRDMFEPHSLHRRISKSVPIAWDINLSDRTVLGTDPSAPWDEAALLYKWGKEGGQKDDSFSKGQVAKPRTPTNPNNPSHLNSSPKRSMEERNLDHGLAMYCVDCGFGGSATIWGEIEVTTKFFRPFVKKVETRFDATFTAGLNLGMQAFVKYEKKHQQDLARIPISGFTIPALASVGPFVSLSVEAKAGIKSTGSLLMGAEVQWDDIDAKIDLLSPRNSYANNIVPSFSTRAESSGQVNIEASLGMPLKLGVGISIMSGFWKAEAVIRDTPAASLGAGFTASADTTGTNINGGCYGVAWDINFGNTLQAVVAVDGFIPVEYDLIEPLGSEPIAEGCIAYKKPAPACSTLQVITNPTIPKGQTCKKTIVLGRVLSKYNIGQSTTVKDSAACAAKCLTEKKCVSFTLSKKKACQLHNTAVKSLQLMFLPDLPNIEMFDKQCFAYKQCPA